MLSHIQFLQNGIRNGDGIVCRIEGRLCLFAVDENFFEMVGCLFIQFASFQREGIILL